MYVTVSLKIELDATASLSQMERQIAEAGRAASDPKPSNKLFVRVKSSRKGAQSVEAHRSSHRERNGESRLSCYERMEMPLKRLRCQQCGQMFRPKDALFGRSAGAQRDAGFDAPCKKMCSEVA